MTPSIYQIRLQAHKSTTEKRSNGVGEDQDLTKIESLSKYSFRYYLIQIGEKGFAYGSYFVLIPSYVYVSLLVYGIIVLSCFSVLGAVGIY